MMANGAGGSPVPVMPRTPGRRPHIGQSRTSSAAAVAQHVPSPLLHSPLLHSPLVVLYFQHLEHPCERVCVCGHTWS